MSDPLVTMFLDEARRHGEVLLAELAAPETDPARYEGVVNAAQSVKGAALIVSADAVARMVDPIERVYAAAQRDGVAVDETTRRELLRSAKALSEVAALSADDFAIWSAQDPSAPPDSTLFPEDQLRSLSPSSHGRDLTMLELFRMEVAAQSTALGDALVAVEASPDPRRELERAMRAAHSIKGAARVLQVDAAVSLAHVMEDYFVAAQAVGAALPAEAVDVLLSGLDVLSAIAEATKDDFGEWLLANGARISSVIDRVKRLGESGVDPRTVEVTPQQMMAPPPDPIVETRGRVVKVSAENMNRLMGMAGELVVGGRRLEALVSSARALRDRQRFVSQAIDELAAVVQRDASAMAALEELRAAHEAMTKQVEAHGEACDDHVQRSNDLSSRLYRDVMESRMRPFSDGTKALPRMVRDIARSLGKKVKLEVIGAETKVDRDILERLDSPLTHILRNAIDHGVEPPAERNDAGKPEQATVKLEARHRAGTLSVTITDDGRGIDLEALRRRVVERGVLEADVVERLSEPELLECIFLPGLSTAKTVTDLSGRGVGLDVVKTVVQEVGGSLRVHTDAGRGTSFHLQLPLTLSVIRAIVVEIAGDPYAIPLSRIDKVVRPQASDIQDVEGRQYISLDGRNIGLVEAKTVLELDDPAPPTRDICIVVVSAHASSYGLRVTRLLGEDDLVVRPLDPRLGAVPDISAASIMAHGEPLLILDVEQVVQSIENTLGRRVPMRIAGDLAPRAKKKKRALIVDDSITVREVERQIMTNRGFEVDVAIDGVDGLQAARRRPYDIIVTDVDMPRMNGIDLVRSLKADERLRSVPIIIVSYKDRPEDRLRGLEAGASYYLTKSSFDDHALTDTVVELIGEPEIE